MSQTKIARAFILQITSLYFLLFTIGYNKHYSFHLLHDLLFDLQNHP
jgi:cytochrome c oxidase assembly factor CtaG